MKETLNIALVAHDSRKKEIMNWVKFNADLLSNHHLYATGTTGKLISELSIVTETDGDKEVVTYPFKDKVTRLLSGPLGGDQQIGAMIATGQVDMLIFFCDNLVMQGLLSKLGFVRCGTIYVEEDDNPRIAYEKV